MEPQDSRPLKTPDEKRSLLEEALSKPDLFRLYELLRPAEGRGPLSEKDIERITRLEVKSRAELERLYRPLQSRVKRREAEAAPPKKNRRLPTLVGRISRVPPALAFIADLGGITLLILAGLKWVGAI